MHGQASSVPRSLLALLTLGLTLAPAACDDDDAGRRAASTAEEVGPGGGVIDHPCAQLTVPAGALGGPVTLTVATVEPPVPLPAGQEAVGGVFGLTPHGQVFATPATVTLSCAGSGSGLTVLTLDGPTDTLWEPVPGVTVTAGVATFPVSHLSFYAVSRPTVPATALLTTLAIPDAAPGALVVNAQHELVVFDASTANAAGRPHLRFVAVTRDEASGRFAFDVTADWLPVPWTSGIPQGWLVRDRHHDLIYALGLLGRTTDAGIGWDQLWVLAVAGHTAAGTLLVNPEGGRPIAAPVDFRIAVAGFAIKEAHREGDGPTRLFVHDIVGGTLLVLTLDPSGTGLAEVQRHAYRSRLEAGCSWPPAPPPWQCHWLGTLGNTLALEWRLESATPPGLPDRDRLYVTDHNYSGTRIRVLEIAQSGPLAAQDLPDVDLATAHDVLANGIEGLTLAAQADRLYVATGLQSFQDGYLGTVDTATQQPGVVVIPGADRGDVLVDPTDPRRVFVVAADSFAPSPALRVHELLDGVVVDTLEVLASYSGDRVAGLAYDPEYGLLYLVVDGQLLVVQVG